MDALYQLSYSPAREWHAIGCEPTLSYRVRSIATVPTPSQIGAAAEREVAYALESAGWTVFLPVFAAHTRVDLVGIGDSGFATRIQVKTTQLARGGTAIFFRTCSNTNNVSVAYDGEVDAFGLWCPSLRTAYLLPIEDAPTRGGHLRLTPPANNQRAGVRFAADYEIIRQADQGPPPMLPR